MIAARNGFAQAGAVGGEAFLRFLKQESISFKFELLQGENYTHDFVGKSDFIVADFRITLRFKQRFAIRHCYTSS